MKNQIISRRKCTMKQVVLHKFYNPDRLFGGYGWSLDEVRDGWNGIYSDPYCVEIPDEFHIGETVTGERMFFKDGCDTGYTLTIGRSDCANGNPYLVGGNHVEMIKLNVLGLA
jgi:hypothetical protein